MKGWSNQKKNSWKLCKPRWGILEIGSDLVCFHGSSKSLSGIFFRWKPKWKPPKSKMNAVPWHPRTQYADVSDILSDQSWGDSIMKPFSLVSWMCVTLGVCCEGEMQYTDNVLLMMLEQEVAELKEAASRQMGALSGKKAGFRWSSQYTKIKMIKVSIVVGLAPLFCDFHQPSDSCIDLHGQGWLSYFARWSIWKKLKQQWRRHGNALKASGCKFWTLIFQDLRARNDALSEAKLQAEIQKEVERGLYSWDFSGPWEFFWVQEGRVQLHFVCVVTPAWYCVYQKGMSDLGQIWKSFWTII